VLIGCRRVAAYMLDDVPWGSEQVLEATRASLASAGLSTQLLESRQDIDTPDDVRRWKAESGALSPPA
jgi:glycosyltransferase A (GT-A) superfamily protein (DUF2064 family)